ncbi:MAG: hypothetical protein ACWA5R_06795 [bacterium]
MNFLKFVMFITFYFMANMAIASSIDLKHDMSQGEFIQAGLNKLSPEELQFLQNWLNNGSIKITQSQQQSNNSSTNSPKPAIKEDKRGFFAPKEDAIVSSIEGKFKGWRGKTRFELSNGQVWIQMDGKSNYVNLNNPKVTIRSKLFGSWSLKVEGSNKSCKVKRLK